MPVSKVFVQIKPELIIVGDLIEVTYPEKGGMITSHRGRVESISAHGGMRHFLTSENAVIARYSPGVKSDLRFVLIDRMPVVQEMFDLFNDYLVG